jgi:hypothetical protein
MELGFTQSDNDRCLFLRGNTFLVIYVDDILIASDNNSAITELFDRQESKYGVMTKHTGKEFEYLGMEINCGVRGQVNITMNKYIKSVIESWDNNNIKVYQSPATEAIFDVDEDSLMLSRTGQGKFHAMVAKLLYLAKHARPEILTAVSMLTTRVERATENNYLKLSRVIGYLKGFPNLGLCLGIGNKKTINLDCYVDASFGVHADAKSHTGVFLSLGCGPIYVNSTKQKIVTKSSFEAEIVAVSDAGSVIIWVTDLLKDLGFGSEPAVLFQDNDGAIAAIKKGEVNGRNTKHIKIRKLWIIERIHLGDFTIQWVESQDMTADILTKGMVGQKFIKLSAVLRGTILC